VNKEDKIVKHSIAPEKEDIIAKWSITLLFT